jgi:hypothetical protein
VEVVHSSSQVQALIHFNSSNTTTNRWVETNSSKIRTMLGIEVIVINSCVNLIALSNS